MREIYQQKSCRREMVACMEMRENYPSFFLVFMGFGYFRKISEAVFCKRDLQEKRIVKKKVTVSVLYWQGREKKKGGKHLEKKMSSSK